MDITLFELHFPNAEFNAPFARQKPDREADEASGADAPTRANGPRKPLLTLLAALAAFLALRRLTRSETPLDDET